MLEKYNNNNPNLYLTKNILKILNKLFGGIIKERSENAERLPFKYYNLSILFYVSQH